MYNSDIPTRAELPSSVQLLRSTIVAIISAAVILVTIVLPSEYAIDPTGIGRVLKLTDMGEIKQQLAEEAEKDRAADEGKAVPASTAAPGQQSGLLDRIVRELFISSAVAQDAARKDEMSVTLKPSEGTEVKLTMKKGAKVNFDWSASGGTVNFDLHGDGANDQSTSYEKGRGAPGAKGVLEAAFDGNHGWFWRNRGDSDVTVTLKTDGAYSEIKRVE